MGIKCRAYVSHVVTWFDYTLLQVTALLLAQHIFQNVVRLWVDVSAGE
jgi:hypothetical protein